MKGLNSAGGMVDFDEYKAAWDAEVAKGESFTMRDIIESPGFIINPEVAEDGDYLIGEFRESRPELYLPLTEDDFRRSFYVEEGIEEFIQATKDDSLKELEYLSFPLAEYIRRKLFS